MQGLVAMMPTCSRCQLKPLAGTPLCPQGLLCPVRTQLMGNYANEHGPNGWLSRLAEINEHFLMAAHPKDRCRHGRSCTRHKRQGEDCWGTEQQRQDEMHCHCYRHCDCPEEVSVTVMPANSMATTVTTISVVEHHGLPAEKRTLEVEIPAGAASGSIVRCRVWSCCHQGSVDGCQEFVSIPRPASWFPSDLLGNDLYDQLQQEVHRNGFGRVFDIPEPTPGTPHRLQDLVQSKFECVQNKTVQNILTPIVQDRPILTRDQILSVILYTGTDVMKAVHAAHRRGDFDTWSLMRLCLTTAISKLSSEERYGFSGWRFKSHVGAGPVPPADGPASPGDALQDNLVAGKCMVPKCIVEQNDGWIFRCSRCGHSLPCLCSGDDALEAG